MKFEKYHALGNDYLIYDPDGENNGTESLIQATQTLLGKKK